MTKVLAICPDSNLLAALQAGFSQMRNPVRLLVLREYPRLDQVVSLVRARHPKCVLISLSRPEPALGLIEGLHAVYPNLALVAVHSASSGELILAAVRKGATRYVGSPFDPEELREAVEAAPPGAAAPKGRLAAIVPAAGGDGASTIALHLAVAMSQAGARTLLTDFDVSCSSLEFRLRLRPAFTLADAFERAADLDDLWAQLTTRWKELEILPAPRASRAPPEIWGRTPAILSSARAVYDRVVADLPAQALPTHGEVIAQADEVLLVCTPGPLSLHLARRKLEELRDYDATVRLVVNRIGSRYSWSQQEIEKLVGRRVDHILCNDYAATRQACMEGALVEERKELGRQLQALASAVMKTQEPGEAPASAKVWRWLQGGKFSWPEQRVAVGADA